MGANYVPSTPQDVGAEPVGSVSAHNSSGSAHYNTDIQLNTLKLNPSATAPSFSEGKLFYDKDNKTMSAMVDSDITMQLGQEELVLCYNGTGTLIPNGSVVAANGASGDMPSIILAKADADLTSRVLGLATQDIPAGASGLVCNRGIVHSVNTAGFNTGGYIYLSDTTAGVYTQTPPTSPQSYVIILGRALLTNATTGSIYVRILSNNRMTDLSDVTVTTPNLDQVLTYNGTEWVNGSLGTISSGAGVVWYPDTSSSGIGTYDNIYDYPSGGAEVIESKVVTQASGEVLIDAYITPVLGRTTLYAGTWSFDTYTSVSNAANTTQYVARVYKYSSGGVETELFNATSTEINNTVVQMVSAQSVQPQFTIAATDRILIKYFAKTDSAVNITVNLYHNGTSHYSSIKTPLHTLHNDLAGLQGGTGSERYHVTQSMYNTLGNTSGSNTGDQSSIVGISGTLAQFNTAITDGDIPLIHSWTQTEFDALTTEQKNQYTLNIIVGA